MADVTFDKKIPMKKTTLLIIAALTIGVVSASAKSTHVKGYTKKDGTYVAPHDRSAPNKSKKDNWSSKGNMNPETGKEGAVDPDKEKKQ